MQQPYPSYLPFLYNTILFSSSASACLMIGPFLVTKLFWELSVWYFVPCIPVPPSLSRIAQLYDPILGRAVGPDWPSPEVRQSSLPLPPLAVMTLDLGRPSPKPYGFSQTMSRYLVYCTNSFSHFSTLYVADFCCNLFRMAWFSTVIFINSLRRCSLFNDFLYSQFGL